MSSVAGLMLLLARRALVTPHLLAIRFAGLLGVLSSPSAYVALQNAIVSPSFLSLTGLHQGDTFGVTLTNGARVSPRAATVAQYFPSLDPTGQVRSLLLFEEIFLLGTAIVGGIVAGVLTTRLFVPYLPIAANVVPPFIVVMPWLAVGEFVLAVLVVFLLVLSIHVSLLPRVQLGQVLRLGEA